MNAASNKSVMFYTSWMSPCKHTKNSWHSTSTGADQREKKYTAHRQFGDRRGGVISARTYFYADEAKCDNQMETFINCIKASGEISRWTINKKRQKHKHNFGASGKSEMSCQPFAGGASADGFSAIKMTALGRPQFLVSWPSWDMML